MNPVSQCIQKGQSMWCSKHSSFQNMTLPWWEEAGETPASACAVQSTHNYRQGEVAKTLSSGKCCVCPSLGDGGPRALQCPKTPLHPWAGWAAMDRDQFRPLVLPKSSFPRKPASWHSSVWAGAGAEDKGFLAGSDPGGLRHTNSPLPWHRSAHLHKTHTPPAPGVCKA